MPIHISSQHNPYIKNIVKLRRRRHRDKQRLTIVEGVRETGLALQMGIVPSEVYFCPALLDNEATDSFRLLQSLAESGKLRLLEVTSDVFAKIAVRGESGGLLMVTGYFDRSLTELALEPSPFLVVVENVEKPGNLGAILRTADAAGVDAVIVSGENGSGGTDLHNPNVVRASLGALFSVPVAAAPSANVIGWLRRHNIRIVAVTPNATTSFTEIDMTGPIALVLGSEAHGLSDAWMSAADDRVAIPMRGVVDSLNLSVASALVIFEVVRQRSKSQDSERIRPDKGG